MTLTTFQRLLRDGCHYQLYAEIEGIPHGFPEREGVLAAPRAVVLLQDDWEAVGQFGNWSNAVDDDANWTNHTGATTSANTGPSGAHSGSRYLYCETSGPATGAAFHLVTALAIDLTDPSFVGAELSIWVHMYGASMGTLSIQAEDQAAPGTWTTLWSRTGQWQTATTDPYQLVTVSLATYLGRTIKLRLRYTRGSSFTGDAAVDLATVTAYTLEPELVDDVESFVPALLLEESLVFDQEMDREGGVARADAIMLQLSWAALEEHGLIASLFSQPVKRHRLTADFASGVDSELHVEPNDEWAEEGEHFWLGRERFSHDAFDGATFVDPVPLGPMSNRRIYKASSPTSFGFVTDKPEVWIGREVVIYMVLLSPEGRMLGGWKDPVYSQEVWRGTVDEDPDDADLGKVIRCLPLVRLPTAEVGYEIGCQVLVPPADDALSIGAFPIVEVGGAQIRLRGSYTGSGGGTFDVFAPVTANHAALSVEDWCRRVQDSLTNSLTGAPWFDGIEVSAVATYFTGHAPAPGQLSFRLFVAASHAVEAYLDIPADPRLYFVSPAHGLPAKIESGNNVVWGSWNVELPRLMLTYGTGAWLPVFQTEGAGFLDLEIPSAGLAVAENEGAQELIRWDAIKDALAPHQGVKLLRLAERQILGTGPVDMVQPGTKLKLVAGAAGAIGETLLTLLTSSGAGVNGANDTLATGLGYGLSEDRIDLPAFATTDLAESRITAVAGGRASLEHLLGGWLALLGKCLVQRRAGDGRIKVTIVDTEPTAVVAGVHLPLERHDVELDGVGRPAKVKAVNQVLIDRSGVGAKLPKIRVGDNPAIQASRPRTAEFKAAGMMEALGIQLAMSRIVLGRGQRHQDISVALWSPLQIGDPIDLRTAHPTTVNPISGVRAPPSLGAVVVGDRVVPYSGKRRLKLRLVGTAPELLHFAPVFAIAELVSDTIVFSMSEAARLAAYLGVEFGDGNQYKLRLYNPGKEAAGETAVYTFEDYEVDELTAMTALGAWVSATTLVTWPTSADASEAQKEGWVFQGVEYKLGGG